MIGDTVDAFKKDAIVSGVISPLSSNGSSQLSKDKTIGYISLNLMALPTLRRKIALRPVEDLPSVYSGLEPPVSRVVETARWVPAEEAEPLEAEEFEGSGMDPAVAGRHDRAAARG